MKKALSILTIILCITGFVACTSNEKTKEVKNDNNINKFIGTYRFDCYDGYHSIIIVKEDGRCLIKKGNRGPEYLGKIKKISSDAFMLESYDSYTFKLYTHIEQRTDFSESMDNWYKSTTVFDVSEGKLYKKRSEYDNRDIATAEYAIMTHDSSTAPLKKTCITCGKNYCPDDEAIVSNKYCTNDYPQTCKYCDKTFTFNTDRDACLDVCGYCYERKKAKRIYESATGRKVY